MSSLKMVVIEMDKRRKVIKFISYGDGKNDLKELKEAFHKSTDSDEVLRRQIYNNNVVFQAFNPDFNMYTDIENGDPISNKSKLVCVMVKANDVQEFHPKALTNGTPPPLAQSGFNNNQQVVEVPPAIFAENHLNAFSWGALEGLRPIVEYGTKETEGNKSAMKKAMGNPAFHFNMSEHSDQGYGSDQIPRGSKRMKTIPEDGRIFSLPDFSHVVVEAIEKNQVQPHFKRFVRECARHLETIVPDPSKSDYKNFCGMIAQCFPFCRDPDGVSYDNFKSLLSKNVRNFRQRVKAHEIDSTIEPHMSTSKRTKVTCKPDIKFIRGDDSSDNVLSAEENAETITGLFGQSAFGPN